MAVTVSVAVMRLVDSLGRRDAGMDTAAANVMVLLVMVLAVPMQVVVMGATIAGVVDGGRGITGCVAVVARL